MHYTYTRVHIIVVLYGFIFGQQDRFEGNRVSTFKRRNKNGRSNLHTRKLNSIRETMIYTALKPTETMTTKIL